MTESPLIASLRAAVAALPDDVPLRLHLAALLLDGGSSDEAVTEIAAALQREPGSTQARALMLRAVTPAAAPAAAALAPPPTPPSPSGTPPATDEASQPAPEAAEFDWDAAQEQVRDIVGPAFVTVEPGDGGAEFQADDGIGFSEVRLDDVGGMAQVKERLEAAFFAPMRNEELRRLYKKQLGGGLLLYGPPGCGKTFLARAVAGELGARFYPVTLADVLDMYLGESERKLHEIFQTARRNTPCVLFLDEVDALGQKRSQVRGGSMRTIVNQLLTELDGVQHSNEGVFVLAATNHPWDVDTALRRPGRLDRTLLVLPPDEPARQSILRYHLQDRPVEGIDLPALARGTDGYSGADLAHVADSAAERALLESARSGQVRMIGMADVEAALREVKPSIGAWLETARAVAMFANEAGTYDELLVYLRQRGLL